jgi:hypothetical protein
MKKYSFDVPHPYMTILVVTICFATVVLSVYGIIYLIENIEVHERIS